VLTCVICLSSSLQHGEHALEAYRLLEPVAEIASFNSNQEASQGI
jgi:hypothetical protein